MPKRNRDKYRLRESSPQDFGWQENNGPWYSDGQFQSSVAHYNVPRSYMDVGGHRHDAGAARGGTREQQYANDREYADHMYGSPNYLHKAMGFAVDYGGWMFHSEYTDEPNPKRLRGGAGDESLSDFQDEMEDDHIKGAKGEVGLKPFSKAAYIQPTYTTQKFKYVATWNDYTSDKLWKDCAQPDIDGNKQLRKRQWRVNSPLDPSLQAEGNNSVNGWNEYRTRYKWYRLVENKIQITLFVQPRGKNSAAGVSDDALNSYANELNARGRVPIVVGMSLNPGHLYPYTDNRVASWTQLVESKYTQWNTLIPESNERCTFSFTYVPNTWEDIVAEQQKEQFWTKTNQAPGIIESVCIWMQSIRQEGVYDLQGIITMDMTCQFREWSEPIVTRSLLIDTKNENYTATDTTMIANMTDEPREGT